jgi:hypothetical protein
MNDPAHTRRVVGLGEAIAQALRRKRRVDDAGFPS